jgi:hypothetical protein
LTVTHTSPTARPGPGGVGSRGVYPDLSLQTGIEASAALAITVNMINTTANYQSGAELRFEGAHNEHFPFNLAAGVGGYKQLTPGGGSGDMVGAFRGRVAAIGPLLSYTFKEGTQEVTQRPMVS